MSELDPRQSRRRDRPALRVATDLYHRLVTRPWSVLMALVFITYISLNTLFALLYLLGGGGIEGARPGHFGDAFFFSVETLSTVGFGAMSPRSPWVHAMVTVETVFGLMGLALVTGLVFAKFSRATARVAFSKVLCFTTYEGAPALLIRMANERRNYVVEAQLRLTLLEDHRTVEGESMRRMADLDLARSNSPFFYLSWQAVHTIDEASPLYCRDLESLKQADARIVASFIGLDESLGQTIHARRLYSVDDFRWGARFVDVISKRGETRVVDNSRLDETTPAPPPSFSTTAERALPKGEVRSKQ